MQNAKDTFYITLRTRLAALNPARTMVLRGVTRPGILVEDAESPMAELPTDVFILRWTTFSLDTQLPAPLAAIGCEILYTAAGTQANAGLDRGRALAAMDDEIMQLLDPYSAMKVDYTVSPATAMNTAVFWTPASLAAATPLRERISRSAAVTVFAFEEQGEK